MLRSLHKHAGGTALHGYSSDVQAPGVSDEAYATIVAQDGWHACSAAVLGRILRQLDSSRRRAVLVLNVSTATRLMLKRDNLWEIVAMDPPYPLPQNVLPWFRRNPLFALQAQLWSLPYRRVLYFDTDHVPMPDDASRLLGLWRFSPTELLLATSEGHSGCFNSGFMLLRPGPPTKARMRAAAEHLARNESRHELHKLERRCPYGWNLDQPLINYVFPPGAWKPLLSSSRGGGESTPWRMLTTFHLLHVNHALSRRMCGHGKLSEVADSVHYMAPFRPWLRAEEHRSCVLFGRDCLTRTDVARFARETGFANASQFWPWLNCSFWASTAAVWWAEFMRLDVRSRQVCERRMSR